VRRAECRVQNVEYATIRAARRDGGTGGEGQRARKLPKRQTAGNGREPGSGEGQAATSRISRKPAASARARAGIRESETGNPPEAGRPGNGQQESRARSAE